MKPRILLFLFATIANIGFVSAGWENPDYKHIKVGNLYYNCVINPGTNNGDAWVVAEGEAPNNYAGLTTINIPNTISYGGYTFYVKRIDYKAFAGCQNLKNITVGGNVNIIHDYAFQGCTGITNINLSPYVTSIYGYVFDGCTSLSSVTLGDRVYSISANAFRNCTALMNIDIPGSISEIGKDAFYNVGNVSIPEEAFLKDGVKRSNFGSRMVNGYVEGMVVYFNKDKTSLMACSSATTGNFTIPNSVTAIHDHAFWGCTKLTSISIPNSVTKIWSKVFHGCTGLTSLNIPNSVTSIGEGTFEECTGLISMNIPNSVVSIGEGAFRECSSLTSVTMSNQIPDIGDKYFYNCKNLASFTISDECTNIGESAFFGCSSLKTIIIPDKVTNIGDNAFASCINLKEIYLGKKISQMNANIFSNCSKIKHVNWNIPSLEKFKFSYAKLESITFGDAVLRIPDEICDGQDNLATVNIISDKITVVGEKAFNGCVNLSAFHFPDALQKIKTRAFKDVPLHSITIPIGVNEIGVNAFTGCNPKIVYWNADGSSLDPSNMEFGNRLEELYLGDQVKIIHPYLFKDQTKIKELHIPSGRIKTGAFMGCSGLQKLSLGIGVTKFDGTAFKNCTNISGALVLPDALDTIPSGVFDNCTKIVSVTIGKNVKKISGFNGCTGIKTVYNFSYMSLVPHTGGVDNPAYYADRVYNNMEVQGEFVFSGTSLIGYTGNATDVTLPATYKNSSYIIGANAFADASQLTSVTIPTAVTSIGESAFAKCFGLTSITIPISVTSIGQKAFENCTNISEFHCEAQTPPTANANTFSNVPTSATLYIPGGSLSAYSSAPGWSKFTNIVEENLVNTTGVSLNATTLNIMKQTEAYLRATISPANATYKTVTWSSSDNTIATVKNGVVYGKKPGTATITCTTTHGGKTATCEVTVTDVERLATDMELYKSAYWENGQSMVPHSAMVEGDTLTFMELGIGFIIINVYPYSVTNGEINWEVSDPSIVSTELTEHINFANSIRIKPLHVGTTKITIFTTDGSNISKNVYVKITPDPTIKVSGIRILKKELTLAAKETDTLSVQIIPTNATNTNVEWSSTDLALASVFNVSGTNRGVVTAKNLGKTGPVNIICTTKDGNYSDTCVVTVIKQRVSVTGLALNQKSKTLGIGEKIQLSPIFTPANPTNKNVYWYMSNDTVVTLDNGLVTAIQEGYVTVYCVSEDGNYEASCVITVTNEGTPVAEPITVRLKASSATGWSKVNLYYWSDGITSPAWPGITISKDADGWYSHTFDESVTSVNIIWNDGNNQTADITGITESTCYSLKSTSGKTIGVNVVECQAATSVTVTGVSLNKKTLQMVVGNTATLTASVLPANASNKSVTWTSSNTATATISSTGTISAKAEGVTTITCKTVDGNFTAECYVVVSAVNSEYNFSYEPSDATVINYTATELSYNEMPENNCVFAALADNAHTLNLMYVGSLVNGVIPQGNYKITSTLQNGTFCYSVGGDDQYDYGSYLATDFNSEGQYSSAYYVIAGDIIIGSKNSYDVKVISANGTEINVTYNLTQDIEDIQSVKNASKILHNGQIYILRGNKIYSVTGQEVK